MAKEAATSNPELFNRGPGGCADLGARASAGSLFKGWLPSPHKMGAALVDAAGCRPSANNGCSRGVLLEVWYFSGF